MMNTFEKGFLTTALLLLALLGYHTLKSKSHNSHTNQYNQSFTESDKSYKSEKIDYTNLNKNIKTNKFKAKNNFRFKKNRANRGRLTNNELTNNGQNRNEYSKDPSGITSNENNSSIAKEDSSATDPKSNNTSKDEKKETTNDDNTEDDKDNSAEEQVASDSDDTSDFGDFKGDRFDKENERAETKPKTTTSFVSFSSVLDDDGNSENDKSQSDQNPPAQANAFVSTNDNKETDPEVESSSIDGFDVLLQDLKFEEALEALEISTTDMEKIESFKSLVRFSLASDVNTAQDVESLIQSYYFRSENLIFMTSAMISDDFTFAEKKYSADLISKSIQQVPESTEADTFAQIYFNGVRALLPAGRDNSDSEEIFNLYLNLDSAIENKYNDLSNPKQIATN